LQKKIGPCSGQRLKELAACGRILPTDTVWKEGIEKGVTANKVKNLFRAVPISPARDAVPVAKAPLVPPPATVAPAVLAAAAPPCPVVEPDPIGPGTDVLAVEAAPAPPPAPVAVAAEPNPGREVSTPPSVSSWGSHQTRKGRATAGRGAVLVGQDGVNVKFRKKCTACGHADSSWTTMPIRNGVMRIGFYCPKCRKHRDVEVHGSLN
jgi:ribosomal protein L33